MPGDDLPEKGFFNIPYFDKIVHFGLYFILALLLVYPLKNTRLPVYTVVLAFSFLLGGGLELLQDYCTTSRSGSWFDLLADLTGAFSGLILFAHYSLRREAKRSLVSGGAETQKY